MIFLDIHLFLFHVALTLNWNKFTFFHLICIFHFISCVVQFKNDLVLANNSNPALKWLSLSDELT